MHDRYFTDEELVAFLDGEDDFASVADITRALKSDAALAKRVDALRIDRTAIVTGFAGLEPAPGAIPDFTNIPVGRTRYGLGFLAAAASVALVIGLGLGIWISRPKPSGWTDYVAAYQVLYSNATLAHINQSDIIKQAELDRVLAAIGKSFTVSTLDKFPDTDYKRAQVLSFEGRALVQLAFTTSTGEPLALCIIRSQEDANTAMQVGKMEGLSSAHWSKNGYEYFLIGGRDDALVSRIGAEFVAMDI